jgi:hypothetical protein
MWVLLGLLLVPIKGEQAALTAPAIWGSSGINTGFPSNSAS